MTIASADRITILRAGAGQRATKRIRMRRDGGIVVDAYDNAKHWRVEQASVGGLVDLVRVLDDAVAPDPTACVIRGEPIEGIDREKCRRLVHTASDGHPPTFRDQPRRWLLLDFDGVPPDLGFDELDGELQGLSLIARFVPSCFRGCSFWWSYTSSAGLPGRDGLRMRLAFWLSRALGEPELERLFDGRLVDFSLFRPIQCHYVARPIFVGMQDPIAERSGVCWDFRNTVEVPDASALQAVADASRRDGTDTGRPHQRRHARSSSAVRRTPEAVLEDACARVARTSEAGPNAYNGSGRRHALFCAALRMSSLISEGAIAKALVSSELSEAARFAGLSTDEDILPHIENGLRQGGVA